MPAARALLLPAAATLALALGGCGEDPAGGDAGSTGATGPATGTTRTTPTVTSAGRPPADAAGDASDAGATGPAPPAEWTASCPTATPSALGCRGVRGRVLAIQSYDPDGDGDLHVIAIGGDVTAPGITVFDVRPSLRPARDPVKGEYVTGAGPVFRGSLDQKQIQVDVFRVWRPGR